MREPARPGNGRRRTRNWHRWLGILLSIPLLHFSVTGILLNHAGRLGWDERHADAPWILKRYGMALSGAPVLYTAADIRVAEWDGHLFIDGTSVAARGTLVGVLETPAGIAAVCRDAIHLFSPAGELLESLGESSLPPGNLQNAGPSLTVRTEDGRLWRYSDDLLAYAPSEGPPPGWSAPVPVSGEERRLLEAGYRGPGLPWSRILLDLHSGRILGAAGPWLTDLAALLFIVLAGTGLALSGRSRTKPGAPDA